MLTRREKEWLPVVMLAIALALIAIFGEAP